MTQYLLTVHYVELQAEGAWVFREESGRCIATLVRVLGDIDLAEDAVEAYDRAIALTSAEPERRYLARPRAELT